MDTLPLYNELMNLSLMTVIILQVPLLRKALIPVSEIATDTIKLASDKKGRFITFDVLRGIAMIGVILIHVAYLIPFVDFSVKPLAVMSLDTFMRFSIPIFFITSGVLLTVPERGFRGYVSFVWRRLVSIVPPYLIVTGVLAFIHNLTFFDFIKNVYTGAGAVPFYFVIVLLQLYLVYPLVAGYSKKRWFVFVVFWFSLFFQFMFPLWYVFGIPLFMRFLFFFVWGIYMKEQMLTGSFKKSYLPWILIITLFLVLFVLYPDGYYNFRPFYGVALTMVLFTYFTQPIHLDVVARALAWVGSISLWIFLTHFSVMELMLPYVWNNTGLTGYPLLVTLSIVSVVMSIAFGFFSKLIYESGTMMLTGRIKTRNKK